MYHNTQIEFGSHHSGTRLHSGEFKPVCAIAGVRDGAENTREINSYLELAPRTHLMSCPEAFCVLFFLIAVHI